jgi:hypothetical protein
MADSQNNKFDGNSILVPQERVHERAQGCWNCIHMRAAKPFWNEQRQSNLQIAVGIAKDSILGENDQKVINIRRMVDYTDNLVAQALVVQCGKTPKGKTAYGDPVGDLVANAYLCDGWSGAQGASVARAGGALDKLPEELVEIMDGPIKKRPLS